MRKIPLDDGKVLSYSRAMSIVNTIINTPKKPAPQDWHKARIKCELELAGYTFAKLSREHGYGDASLQMTVHNPWPKAERIVSEAIGVAPHVIWPSRYNQDGSPKSGRGERGLGRYKRKASRPPSNHSTAGQRRNAKVAVGI